LPREIRIRRLIDDARWLIRIRWVAPAAFLAGMPAVSVAFGSPPAIVPILFISAACCAYNAAFGLFLKRFKTSSPLASEELRAEHFIQLQFLCDTVALSAAVLCTGGPGSPLVIFYLLQVMLTGTILTRRAALHHTAMILVLFAALCTIEHAQPGWRRTFASDVFPLPRFSGKALFAETAGLAAVLFIAAYIAGTLSDKIRHREKALADALNSLAQSTRELREANRKFSQLQQRKIQFIHHAAHQLRSPLAAVESCLSTALGGYTKDPEKNRDLILRGRNRVRRMIELIKDLLALARARVAPPEQMETLVEFDSLVARVVNLRESLAREKDISLHFRPGTSGRKVRGSEGGLEDVASNLISNAIKYTLPKGIVKVKTFVEGDMLVLEVVDTGIGMSREDLEKVFDEFYRASNARKVSSDGTGLGLPIVKETVERHGGSVTIKSLPELGTCVTVTLPLATEDTEK